MLNGRVSRVCCDPELILLPIALRGNAELVRIAPLRGWLCNAFKSGRLMARGGLV